MESLNQFFSTTAERFNATKVRVENSSKFKVQGSKLSLRETLGEEKYLELIKKELELVNQETLKTAEKAVIASHF